MIFSSCQRKKELGLDLAASPRFSEKFTWNSNLKKLRLTSISRQFVTLSVGVSASLPTSNTNRGCLSSYNKTSMGGGTPYIGHTGMCGLYGWVFFNAKSVEVGIIHNL